MKLYLLASSALALLSAVPNVYSQESTTAIVLKGSSATSGLRGSSKFLVKKVEEYALLSKDKGSEGPPGGGGGGPGGGDNGPGGGHGHGDDGPGHGGGPPSGPDDGPGHDHNKHGGPGGPDDDQPGPPGPGHHNHDGPGPSGDDDCPPGMVGCDPATWGPGNKKPPKPPKDDDDDDDGPPKPPHKHHHNDDDDDEGDDDDFDNTREVPDIPYEIKKLGKGYCDTDNQLGHLNKCVELYDEYCKTDLLMEENDDICEYLGYGGDDVVMAME